MLDGNSMIICICKISSTSPAELDFDTGYAPFIVDFQALVLSIENGEVINAIVSDIVADRDDQNIASVNAVAGPITIYVPALRTGAKLHHETGLEEMIDVRDTRLEKEDGTTIKRESRILLRVHNPDADSRRHGITCTGDMVLE